jgi:hypothetical protein
MMNCLDICDGTEPIPDDVAIGEPEFERNQRDTEDWLNRSRLAYGLIAGSLAESNSTTYLVRQIELLNGNAHRAWTRINELLNVATPGQQLNILAEFTSCNMKRGQRVGQFVDALLEIQSRYVAAGEDGEGFTDLQLVAQFLKGLDNRYSQFKELIEMMEARPNFAQVSQRATEFEKRKGFNDFTDSLATSRSSAPASRGGYQGRGGSGGGRGAYAANQQQHGRNVEMYYYQPPAMQQNMGGAREDRNVRGRGGRGGQHGGGRGQQQQYHYYCNIHGNNNNHNTGQCPDNNRGRANMAQGNNSNGNGNRGGTMYRGLMIREIIEEEEEEKEENKELLNLKIMVY